MINLKPRITRDFFYKGKVAVRQNRRGFRFSIDAPLLAHFLPITPSVEALEVGAGSGIVSILALYKNKFAKIFSLEIQKNLFKLAKRNAKINHMTKRMEVIHGDFNEIYNIFTGIPVIFSNPPYQRTGIGKMSPNREIRWAKTELKLNLGDLVTKSSAILAPQGSVYLILPFTRFTELEDVAAKAGLFLATWRPVHSYSDGKPERFLVQLTATRKKTVTEEPMVIFKRPGEYTDLMGKILAGEPHVL